MRAITTALVHAVAAISLVGAPAAGQEAPEPEATEKPILAGPTAEAPADDPVLRTIAAAVEPTGPQLDRIERHLQTLRMARQELFQEMRSRMRGDGSRRRGDGAARPRRGGTATGREDGARRRGRIPPEARAELREKMAALESSFTQACRALLTIEQQAKWDECVGGLDLSPRRTRRGRGGGPDPDRGPAVGETAPPFSLADLDGTMVSLDSLRGRPTVLEFGSYTCPIFRGKVDRLAALRASLGDRVNWVLIYTREAHAVDGRVSPGNTRAGIEVRQHTSMEERVTCARLARDKLGLKVPILVDDLENSVSTAYGGFPNRGYVLDAAGKVVSKQVWIEPERTAQILRGMLGGDADDAG